MPAKQMAVRPNIGVQHPTTVASSQRIHWIDIAKGIGIILVSFGHIRNGDGQSV